MFKYSTKKKRLYYDKVIQLYRDEHLGKRKIAKILPLGENTISTWIRNFVAENPSYRRFNMNDSTKHTPRKSEVVKEFANPKLDLASANEESLRKELAATRRELAATKRQLSDTKLLAEIYNEMINVAESKFNIKIRKKAGTK